MPKYITDYGDLPEDLFSGYDMPDHFESDIEFKNKGIRFVFRLNNGLEDRVICQGIFDDWPSFVYDWNYQEGYRTNLAIYGQDQTLEHRVKLSGKHSAIEVYFYRDDHFPNFVKALGHKELSRQVFRNL